MLATVETATAPQEPTIDYTLAAIQNALVNWDILAMGETPSLIHIRVDLERAIMRLPEAAQAEIRKVQRFGSKAFEANPDNPGYVPVSFARWGTLTRRVFAILNREGTF